MYSIKNVRRISAKHIKQTKSLKGVSPNESFQRFYNVESSSSKAKLLAVPLIGGIGVFGGVVAYAKYDEQFRDALEENIPYSKVILNQILGERKLSGALMSLSQMKKETVAINSNEKMKKSPASDSKPKKDTENRPGDLLSEAKHLHNLLGKKLGTLDIAVQSASDAITIHLRDAHELVSAFNKDSSVDWDKLSLKAQKRTFEMDKIQNIQEEIRIAIKSAESLVGKMNDNKQIESANEIKDLETMIQLANNNMQICNEKLTKLSKELSAAKEFDHLIAEGWNTLKRELQILIPDINLEGKISKLSDEDLNLLIGYYQRKTMHLVAASAHQQAIQNERFLNELGKNREIILKEANSDVKEKLKQQEEFLEIAHRKELSELREEHEYELRKQFRRQSAAHAEHLRERIELVEDELNQKYSSMLDDKVNQERVEYHKKLSVTLGRLKGLEGALRARADLERASRKSQGLWLACHNLKSAIRLGNIDAQSWEDKLQPLAAHVGALKEAIDNNPFASAVLNAIPEEALNDGVYTEDALKERFLKVDKICRKVAMIDDRGGSLLKYLISYIQSLVIINSSETTSNSVNFEDSDIESLNTFDVLNRARYYLDRDDLLQALKYMNLLTGAPREVANDWLKDVRLNLEMRQAADALLTYASATNIQAYAT